LVVWDVTPCRWLIFTNISEEPEGIHSFNSSTIIANETSIAIDKIFVDKSRNYSVRPLINGLSDHDAELIVFNNVIIHWREKCKDRRLWNEIVKQVKTQRGL
jgi:hypothetical protein